MNNRLETRSLKKDRNHAFAQSLLETGLTIAAGIEALVFSFAAANIDFSYYPAVLIMIGVTGVALHRAKVNINTAMDLNNRIDRMSATKPETS